MNSIRNVVCLDRYTRVCLTAIIVLLTLLVVGLWSDVVPRGPQAWAQEKFTDSGTRQVEVLSAVQATNKKLDELISLMTSGKIRVQVVQDDAKGASNAQPPATK